MLRQWIRIGFPALLLSCSPALAAEAPTAPALDGVIDLSMNADPRLEAPPQVSNFHPRLELLWTSALQRPEAELRRQAAEAFNQAKRDGMTGLEDVTPILIEVLKSDPEPSVRLAAAQALVAFDDLSAAAVMLDRSNTEPGYAMMVAVDPALAKWKHQPAYDAWLQRIADAVLPEPGRVSAAQSLAAVGESRAAAPMLAIAIDRAASPQLRIEAARGLAVLHDSGASGVNDQAQTLANGGPIDRVVAAEMLAGDRSGGGESILLQLARDEVTIVAAAAARALNAVDTAILAREAATFVGHRDPLVRGAVAKALAAHPDAKGVTLLAGLLGDPSGENRHFARATLQTFAHRHNLDAGVRSTATAVLAGSDWRALEQAAVLLGELDHEASADRFVELLRFDRPEVRLAAASALREIAVPATLPAMFERAKELTQQSLDLAKAGTTPAELSLAINHETAQLFQAFGQMGFTESEPLLREYVPKTSALGSTARGAAVYALGKFKEDQLDAALAKQLAGRLSDLDPMNPEMPEVRRFSAIALGRMKAKDQLSVLHRFYTEENASADIGGATRWAIIRITGEDLPPLETLEYDQTGWFLQPTN